MFLKDFLYICLSSNVFKVWGDKGIGNIVKTDVLERFYGAKCVNYRVLKGNIAKTCKHTSKVTGFEGFCGKNADNGAKCRWTVFLGVVVAIWNSPAWEAPTGENVALHGLRMAAKFFQIEMKITCTYV